LLGKAKAMGGFIDVLCHLIPAKQEPNDGILSMEFLAIKETRLHEFAPFILT
jgi:hypothetical protein